MHVNLMTVAITCLQDAQDDSRIKFDQHSHRYIERGSLTPEGLSPTIGYHPSPLCGLTRTPTELAGSTVYPASAPQLHTVLSEKWRTKASFSDSPDGISPLLILEHLLVAVRFKAQKQFKPQEKYTWPFIRQCKKRFRNSSLFSDK